jgi:hypothetical protein
MQFRLLILSIFYCICFPVYSTQEVCKKIADLPSSVDLRFSMFHGSKSSAFEFDSIKVGGSSIPIPRAKYSSASVRKNAVVLFSEKQNIKVFVLDTSEHFIDSEVDLFSLLVSAYDISRDDVDCNLSDKETVAKVALLNYKYMFQLFSPSKVFKSSTHNVAWIAINEDENKLMSLIKHNNKYFDVIIDVENLNIISFAQAWEKAFKIIENEKSPKWIQETFRYLDHGSMKELETACKHLPKSFLKVNYRYNGEEFGSLCE